MHAIADLQDLWEGLLGAASLDCARRVVPCGQERGRRRKRPVRGVPHGGPAGGERGLWAAREVLGLHSPHAFMSPVDATSKPDRNTDVVLWLWRCQGPALPGTGSRLTGSWGKEDSKEEQEREESGEVDLPFHVRVLPWC